MNIDNTVAVFNLYSSSLSSLKLQSCFFPDVAITSELLISHLMHEVHVTPSQF